MKRKFGEVGELGESVKRMTRRNLNQQVRKAFECGPMAYRRVSAVKREFKNSTPVKKDVFSFVFFPTWMGRFNDD